MVPAHRYLLPKWAEYDVTPIFTALKKNPLVRMREIDQERGMQSLVVISAFPFGLLNDRSRVGLLRGGRWGQYFPYLELPPFWHKLAGLTFSVPSQ